MGRIEFGTWNLARRHSSGADIYDNIPESEFVNSEFRWACSSVWLERTPDKREVDGSTPSRPTNRFGGVAQLGERLPCTQEVIGSNPFTSTTTKNRTFDRVGGN